MQDFLEVDEVFDDDDDDDDEEDQIDQRYQQTPQMPPPPQEPPPPPPAAAAAQTSVGAHDDSDLLDFSSTVALAHTPVTEGATRASWVAEMNAELAEFDALTGGTSASSPDSRQGWQQSMEAELAQRMSNS